MTNFRLTDLDLGEWPKQRPMNDEINYYEFSLILNQYQEVICKQNDLIQKYEDMLQRLDMRSNDSE